MAIRVAINGFGRIGRCVLRASWNDPDFEVVHINDLTSDETLAYLLKFDTVHGRFGEQVIAVDGGLSVDGTFIATSAERDPTKLPWAEKDIDVVLECTGVFTNRDQLAMHLQAGARKVVLSAPGKGMDATIVLGVNDHEIDLSKHHVVSNASCTTNCLAPTVKVLDQLVGIEKGMVTTVHSYTVSQNILDGAHKKLRRGRAAAENMVPTSTGAAEALKLVLPHLEGKIHGMAVRVPTPDGSLIDLVFESKRDTTAEEINAAFVAAASGAMAGIMQASTDPLVSSDIVGNPHSSIVDLPLTTVMGGNQVKVLAWYDNEWGFSNRMVGLARLMGGMTR